MTTLLQLVIYPSVIGCGKPRGVLEVYEVYLKYTGGSDVFFWVENLHARYFFRSRDLSLIFLGLKSIRIFFWVLSPNKLFISGFRCDKCLIRIIFIRTFFSDVCSCTFVILFWVGNFNARYFFGSKISGLCIFLGLQYEAPSNPPPPLMYTSSTPPPQAVKSSLSYLIS